MTLANLKIGDKAEVTKILGETPATKRLMEMGIVPGVAVRVVKSAPFGDPIEIRVRGYSLAMRKAEAETIEVQILKFIDESKYCNGRRTTDDGRKTNHHRFGGQSERGQNDAFQCFDRLETEGCKLSGRYG